MKIQSFEEIKTVLKNSKEAGGVGYVVAPQLMKIASQLGLIGYEDAILAWAGSQVADEKTYAPMEEISTDIHALLIGFEGPSLQKVGNSFVLGIKRTIEDIEAVLVDHPEQSEQTEQGE